MAVSMPLVGEPLDAPSVPGRPAGAAWTRFRRNRLAYAGLVFVGSLIVLAVTAPALTGLGMIADPNELNPAQANAPVSGDHPWGTDQLGRDLLSRTIYGARISLSIALLAQAVILLIGGTVGLVAGYAGGWVDNLLMRFADVVFAFPDLLFVLVIASVMGPGYLTILVAIGAVHWVLLARLVRGEVLVIRRREYIDAARASGARRGKILFRHVVPNSLNPVIVFFTFGIPAAIFIEAFLSFIGVGMTAPTPSWGVMVKQGYEAIFADPKQVLAPAIAISLTTLSFSVMGDGLRDAFDPRLTA